MPESSPNNCFCENTIEKCVASLYANPQIPRNVVQTVVEDMLNIFDNVHKTLKTKTDKLLVDGHISKESFDHYINILDEFGHPFSNLGTEYKRIKYFTELGSYIAPR
jgi:hypothetical protein